MEQINAHYSCSAAFPSSPQTTSTSTVAEPKMYTPTNFENTHQHYKYPKMKILLFTIVLTLSWRSTGAFTPSCHSINTFATSRQQHQQQPQQPQPQTSRNRIITSAATLNGPPSSYEMSDFARRMKNIISKENKRKPPGSNVNAAPKNLMRIKTLSEFKKIVGDEKEKLVVVRWYAPWCKVRKEKESLN